MHVAIIGITKSGKTFLARQLARIYKSKGYEILVLHKAREPWDIDEVTLQTTSIDVFLDLLAKKDAENVKLLSSGVPAEHLKGYICFMELTDANTSKYDERIIKLFTAGRHDAHKFHYLSQKNVMVHPTIRDNCDQIYLFQCGNESAICWSKEFMDDEMRKATKLQRRQYYYKEKGGPTAKLCTLDVA